MEDIEMHIDKLYVYPIKSLRGISLDTATLTEFGFNYDRHFMILKPIEKDGEKTLKNMTVADFNVIVRFFQEINTTTRTLKVTHKPLDGSKSKPIDIPLEPDTSDLELIDVEMHKSPTRAYKMGRKYDDWFCSCFGYDTIFTYIGENVREVQMSSHKYKSHTNGTTDGSSASSWLSSIYSIASTATGMIMGNGTEKPSSIKFSDVAPYLVVSSKSLDDVDNRLPDGEQFDITKFRPNITVSGAKEPWEEDFWGELIIDGHCKLECEHNCARCKSINIDYDTGDQGKGEAGSMLKKLAKDRRVDMGSKWSPIFGRYSFLHPDCEGQEIRVRDEVMVSRRNSERTAFGEFE